MALRDDEYVVCDVKTGDQKPATEEGLAILGQPPESLVWVADRGTQPVFVDGRALGRRELSGRWMLPVWTRVRDETCRDESVAAEYARLRASGCAALEHESGWVLTSAEEWRRVKVKAGEM